MLEIRFSVPDYRPDTVASIFGGCLGGVTMSHFGDYQWIWGADMVLALLAALINLPIREAQSPKLTTA